ncbi:hypothetical protein NEUTE2DRAFT_143030 [Neurospora tetrasperma FGSC 2509]|nr:hypothetical protein NEUTE2DRAFT_143030 [Neurospora tetrasperma FGSC 2509]
MRLRCLKNIPPPREHSERGGGGGEERKWKTKLLEDGRLCTVGKTSEYGSSNFSYYFLYPSEEVSDESLATS